MSELKYIALKDIYCDESENCRGHIDPVDVYTLMDSIKENGLQEPVLVRPTLLEDTNGRKQVKEPYMLVAGFRRYKAHELLGKEDIECVIRELSPVQAIVINLTENLERKDLNLMQETEAIRRMVRIGMTRKDIVKAIKRTEGWLQPRIYLTQMEPEVQQLAREGVLTAENIRQLWSYKDRTERLAVAKQIRQRRERGFIGAIKIKPPKLAKRNRANIKKARDRAEINNLLEYLLQIGAPFGLHTRALAWASGQITDMELCIDLQDFHNDMTKLSHLVDLTNPTICDIIGKWGMEPDYFFTVPPLGIPDISIAPED